MTLYEKVMRVFVGKGLLYVPGIAANGNGQLKLSEVLKVAEQEGPQNCPIKVS